MYARELNRTREGMRRRIAWLNKKHCKTARELTDTLKEQAKLGREVMRLDAIAAVLKCFPRLIERTPVDTSRARAGWQITGSPGDIEFVPGKSSGAILRALRGAVRNSTFTAEDSIFVFNNVEYILALNAGWSKKQPGNFIDLFLQELRQELEKVAQASRL